MRSSAGYILSKEYLIRKIRLISFQMFFIRLAAAVLVCLPYVLKPMESMTAMLIFFAAITPGTAALLYADHRLSGKKRAYKKVLTDIIEERF